VLVVGLLMVGEVVHAEGLFEAVGARAERIGGGPVVLLATLLGLEAIVTAVLNLDTAAVFLTPVIIHAARQRGCDERPFLYGALFMANAASLLLPGSNLTNLIVLHHERLSGHEVFRAMALPWLVVVVLTIVYLALVYRPRREGGNHEPLPDLHVGIGLAATAATTAAMLVFRNPALPVLAIGLGAVALSRIRPRLDAHVLGGLFVLAVALGTLGRQWDGPAALIRDLGGIATASVAAAASVLVNNLPAASLLAAKKPPHPLPLVVGLNLGPNLAFTGSLSAYLWYRAAQRSGAQPSLKRCSLLGLALVPLTIAGALVALGISDPDAL
jgi:arsenical pump membrane protein